MDQATLEVYMKEAWKESKNSPCSKKQVGAVLVCNATHRVVGRGYGGDVKVCNPCDKKKYEWFQDGCYAVHAEIRAMFDFITHPKETDLHYFTMFVTHGPCDQCMKYMSYFNVGKVVYDEPYKVDYTKWAGRDIEVWHNMERII